MIKCGLVSGRGMGPLHGRNFHGLPDSELVGVCDMDAEALAEATAEFGIPGYATLDEMLEKSGCDLVLLIVNETRRIDPLRQCLAAGKHVFTEKPLCGLAGQNAVVESDALVAAPAIREWRASNLKFGINYNYRYFRHFQRLHNDAVGGVLGEIKMVRARAHYNCWSHVIDQILWTMGAPVWVSAVGDPSAPGGGERMIRMQWPSGVYGELTGTNAWGYDDHPLRIMIVGDKAYGESRGLGGWYARRTAQSSDWEELWEVEEGVEEYGESFGRMAADVIEAMKADKPFPADGEAAWNELLFEAAVHRSTGNDGARVVLAELEAEAMAK